MQEKPIKECQEKMNKAVEAVEHNLGALRTGRASVRLVEGVVVPIYGSDNPLNQVATISTPDATTVAIQPWDPNTINPIEKAKAYRKLMDDFHLTQEQAAGRVGEERSSLANTIRLLEIDEGIQREIARGRISSGHAKVLLSLEDTSERQKLAQRIIKEDLSVRATEEIVGSMKMKVPPPPKAVKPTPAHIRDLEDRFRKLLGTKVIIKENRGKGKIIIEFYTNDDFERILGSIEQGAV